MQLNIDFPEAMSLLDSDFDCSESDRELGHDERITCDDPPPDQFAHKIWKGTKMSLFFFMWAGIAYLPDACPHNHDPKFLYYTPSKSTCQIRCKYTEVYQ